MERSRVNSSEKNNLSNFKVLRDDDNKDVCLFTALCNAINTNDWLFMEMRELNM